MSKKLQDDGEMAASTLPPAAHFLSYYQRNRSFWKYADFPYPVAWWPHTICKSMVPGASV